MYQILAAMQPKVFTALRYTEGKKDISSFYLDLSDRTR